MIETINSVKESDWWRGAVIYQVYPRSFFDSNGDGVGDLPGIISKLDYLSDLGIDAIWISPFFQSPMDDFGYDVSNYRQVDPIFGTLADFDVLVESAKKRRIRVLIDQVVSHTSNRHPWFIESASSRDNSKADWYVWADPRADGTPPNNWMAAFEGSAWKYSPQRRQYYLHNFLESQPDLNFHNPEVVDQVLSDMRFWLERGVQGFRLDTANFYYHDRLLRDNPANPNVQVTPDIANPASLYSWQIHQYDKSQPENLGFLKKVRTLLNEFGETFSVGEIGADQALPLMAQYTQGNDHLHSAYTFDLLSPEFSAERIVKIVRDTEAAIGSGWPCWAMSNHDVMRVATRWGRDREPTLLKSLIALLFSLRGTVCVYQGEELGLTEVDIPVDQIKDPYGLRNLPVFKGRDGCRTPMPWDFESVHAGFTPAIPWLPVDPLHASRSVGSQINDEQSMLRVFQRLVKWRKQNLALQWGSISIEQLGREVVFIRREHEGCELQMLFNLGEQAETVELSPDHSMLLPSHAAWFNDQTPVPSWRSIY